MTQVDLVCGFSHLGRFSALFRGEYGVQPSPVLDRARKRGPWS
ncbi:AraC family transcriptional regulator [Kocuria flava]|nr:AraC family transcriptional regulator [Kocuria flava]